MLSTESGLMESSVNAEYPTYWVDTMSGLGTQILWPDGPRSEC